MVAALARGPLHRRALSLPSDEMSERVEKLLKSDALGRVELVERDGQRLVRRVACGGSIPASALVARALLARERSSLAHCAGLDGVPRLVEATRRSDVLERTHLDGEPLHRCTRLPLDFFERLEELVRSLHARGVAHNDLHKEQNIIVRADGRPGLIDFQLASRHATGSRALAVRARDDLRHIAKHRRRYLRYTRVVDPSVAPPAELRAAPPRPPARSGVALVWRKSAKPLYNFVTRRVLRRRDGEERRATNGDWPQWSPAVGPAAGATADPTASAHITSAR